MENFKPSYTFEISNSISFYDKLLAEYADFDKQHLNPRFAMNCAINSWHLTDWTYQEFFKLDPRFQNSVEMVNGKEKQISGLSKYQQFLLSHCPELKHMRSITNGTKHCISNKKDESEKTITYIGDYDPYEYCRHDFDVARFVIKQKDGNSVDFEKCLLKTIEFWKSFIDNPKCYI